MQTENLNNGQMVESESTFDTKGLLLSFLNHWKWFVLSVVICLAIAVIYIASVIPTYRLDASIYLRETSETASNALSMNATDPMVAFKNFIDETELEVMKSHNNLIKIVDSLNLTSTYYYKGALRDEPLYLNSPVAVKMDSVALRTLKSPITLTIDPEDNDLFTITAKTVFNGVKEEKVIRSSKLPVAFELSHGSVTVERNSLIPDFEHPVVAVIQSPRAMAGLITSNLNIEFAKNSEKIIRISLLDQDIRRGSDIIEAILDFYNRDIIEEKNRSAIQTEAFILDRLVMINNELKDVENRLQEYRQAHNINDIQAQTQLNLTQQSNYEQQMAEIDADMALFDEIEALVRNSETHQTLPTAINYPALTTIIETYNSKVNQYNRALAGSTVNNPLVSRMLEELNGDRMRIMQTIATGKRNVSARRTNLKRLENAASGELASMPPVDKGLQEIFREQQVKVNIYTFLLQRREEIALQKTLATNTARLIDDPLPEGPVEPRKPLILALAIIIGLAIPAGLIFMRKSLFPSFSTKDDLERITKVPILGEISRSKDNTKPIVIGENVATSIAELFRLLRNNLEFTKAGGKNKVILVTSATSGEGKSFVASNLAMTYALSNKKVLLIGLDLRRPRLDNIFGCGNRQGVTTYLSGKVNDINDLIKSYSEKPNLHILTAGPIPPNPNELLISNKMEEMIDTLKNEYDIIIIDSAPIGLVSDTYLITRYADVQIFVTRADYSSRRNIKELHDAIAANKLSSPYIVLNDVNMNSRSYSYQRYGNYGRYGYSYGYGYGDKPEKHHSHKKENALIRFIKGRK